MLFEGRTQHMGYTAVQSHHKSITEVQSNSEEGRSGSHLARGRHPGHRGQCGPAWERADGESSHGVMEPTAGEWGWQRPAGGLASLLFLAL